MTINLTDELYQKLLIGLGRLEVAIEMADKTKKTKGEQECSRQLKEATGLVREALNIKEE